MITTNSATRIDGRDRNDDRWAAHLAAAEPGTVVLRTLGGMIQLELADVASLAQWLAEIVEAEVSV